MDDQALQKKKEALAKLQETKNPKKEPYINIPKVLSRELLKYTSDIALEAYSEDRKRIMISFDISKQADLKLRKSKKFRDVLESWKNKKQ